MSDIQIADISSLAQRQYFKRPADERFETLDLLEASVHGRRLRSSQFNATIKDFKAIPTENGVQFKTGKLTSIPTHYSFSQSASLVKAPAGWLRTLGEDGYHDLVAQNLNAGIAKRQADGVKVMLIGNDDYNTLQAVTSQTYGRIWDADVVKATKKLVAAHPEFENPLEWSGKRGGLYASDRDVFMFLVNGGSIVDGGRDLLNGGNRDQLFRGIMVWNSEVGAATFGISSFLFRTVCGNHLITGIEGVKLLKIKHTSGGPERFVTEAIPALTEYVESSAKPTEDRIRKAKAFLLPKKEEFLDFFVKRGFTKGEVRQAKEFAENEEGGAETLWQMTQGFTRAARDLAFMDAKTELERKAGKLFDTLTVN